MTEGRTVVIGDTDTEAVLEKFVGFLGGFVVLAWGLFFWVPRVGSLSSEIAQRRLNSPSSRSTAAVCSNALGLLSRCRDDCRTP